MVVMQANKGEGQEESCPEEQEDQFQIKRFDGEDDLLICDQTGYVFEEDEKQLYYQYNKILQKENNQKKLAWIRGNMDRDQVEQFTKENDQNVFKMS